MDGSEVPSAPGVAVCVDVPREEMLVKVSEAMTGEVFGCAADATLNDAARVMWERDCGFVPVTERDGGRFVGVVTDRDLCMAAYTQGRPLREIPIATAMAREVVSLRASDDVARAFDLFRRHQLHRLPVVNEKDELVGVLTLTDVARNAAQRKTPEGEQLRTRVGAALGEIGRPRALSANA